MMMSMDVGSGYDFKVDAKGVVSGNMRLSRDLVDSLLEYYDDNVQTVKVVIQQIVTDKMNEQGGVAPPYLQGGGYAPLVEDAGLFIARVSQHVKPSVLQRVRYFERFFGLVVDTLDMSSPSYDDIVRAIEEILKNI